ncbi:MAG: 2TM domain-containing protein [bacterium]|nr:2TM domain-containing protein [bacterium]
MNDSIPSEAELRKKVLKKFEERRALFIHAGIYLFCNALFILGWLGDGAEDFPGPLIITFFWGIGMVAHVLSYYNTYGQGALRREEQIQREIERERERYYAVRYGDKRKNEALALDEDDELVRFEDHPDDSAAQRNQY